ncbi:hypothetical protein AAFF_G00093470 [Aldrovandia affinis]|uniref:Uncharacterized protein n=1 Tax=Aldrovandia affinis TaxID=143900 RepID=A0AAD7WXK7_9TELE|nr:hypothetical protein AAFF_G00093470 [Aldrovandia affinis]
MTMTGSQGAVHISGAGPEKSSQLSFHLQSAAMGGVCGFENNLLSSGLRYRCHRTTDGTWQVPVIQWHQKQKESICELKPVAVSSVMDGYSDTLVSFKNETKKRGTLRIRVVALCASPLPVGRRYGQHQCHHCTLAGLVHLPDVGATPCKPNAVKFKGHFPSAPRSQARHAAANNDVYCSVTTLISCANAQLCQRIAVLGRNRILGRGWHMAIRAASREQMHQGPLTPAPL